MVPATSRRKKMREEDRAMYRAVTSVLELPWESPVESEAMAVMPLHSPLPSVPSAEIEAARVPSTIKKQDFLEAVIPGIRRELAVPGVSIASVIMPVWGDDRQDPAPQIAGVLRANP